MQRPPPLVAVIDDEPSVLTALRLLLEMQGYRVIAGESEAPVIEHLASGGEPPAAIIADYRLRAGRTGIQAIGDIRRRLGYAVPGLIVTGDTTSAWLGDAHALHLTVLQKPVLPRQLAAAIDQSMAQ
ncbi:MAG: response regulator [Solirubrobacterales bacterium]